MIIRRGPPKAGQPVKCNDAQAEVRFERTEPDWRLVEKVLLRDDVALLNLSSSCGFRADLRCMLRDFGGCKGHVRLALTALAMGYAERQSPSRGKPAHLSVVVERLRREWGSRIAASVAGVDVDAWALADKLEVYFTMGWNQGATEKGKRPKRSDKVDRAIQTLMSKEKVFHRTPEADRKAIDRADAVVKQTGEELETRLRAEIAQRPPLDMSWLTER